MTTAIRTILASALGTHELSPFYPALSTLKSIPTMKKQIMILVKKTLILTIFSKFIILLIF